MLESGTGIRISFLSVSAFSFQDLAVRFMGSAMCLTDLPMALEPALESVAGIRISSLNTDSDSEH